MPNVTELRAQPSIVAVPAMPPITLREARFYRRGPRRNSAIWVVIHATAGAEGPRKAEDVAHMFANLRSRAEGGKPRSAHLVIDSNSVVQCVPYEREAFHAGAHANRYGEGIELCGRTTQTRAQWLDALSLPMLQLAARIVRFRCDALGIPIEFCRAPALRTLQPGITTHAEIARAFPDETTHTDPGPHFPLEEFLQAVRSA